MPRVLVTIPHHDTPPNLLYRAIQSVLRQSFEDFVLLLVNDGGSQPTPRFATDERITHLRFGVNRGRYAVDHAVLNQSTPIFDFEMSGCEYWFPLDSDDWVEPEFLKTAVSEADAHDRDVVFAPQTVHGISGRTRIEYVKTWDGSNKLRWHAHLSNLWRIPYVRDNNLTNPTLRVGWDTVMTSVPWLNANVGVLGQAFVHRCVREGSLTTSKETGFRSRARLRAREICERAWRRCVENRDEIPAILMEARSWTS